MDIAASAQLNGPLIAAFTEVRDIYRFYDPYRAAAYDRTIKWLRKAVKFRITPRTLTRLKRQAKEDRDASVQSPGPKSLERIEEFVRTGRLTVLEELRTNPMTQVCKIPGVGPATIKKWQKAGVNSLDSLRKKYERGKVRLTRQQRLGLEYYDDLLISIPRDEITAIGAAIHSYVATCVGKQHLVFDIAGSYRRGSSVSGDVDILLTTREPRLASEIREALALITPGVLSPRRSLEVIAVISAGPERTSLLVQWRRGPVRRVDIMYTPPESYYAALNYFTGSKEHNKWLRGIAARKGFRLNQAGLYRVNKKTGEVRRSPIHLTSEAELYEHLGLPYIAPEDRG